MSYIPYDEQIWRDPRDYDPTEEPQPDLTEDDLAELEQRELEIIIPLPDEAA